MAAWDSLVDALNTGVLGAFGREVTYQPESGGSFPVRAVLREGREPEDNSPGTYALLFVRLADLPQAPKRGDAVIIDGSTYKVFEIEADGQGGVTLAVRWQ
ncbi:MAG: hypothetical protein KIT09_30380 [Bryobacteraceae bacterium]|nr:hypothetical protein [Bryobacteraceae bacterium]